MKLRKVNLLLVFCFLAFFACNTKNSSSILENTRSGDRIITEERSIQLQGEVSSIPSKKEDNLDRLQGIWIGKKDLNQNIPYRIQYKKKVIDIVCLEGLCDDDNTDNTIISMSTIGFSDVIREEILERKMQTSDLKESGKTMIKISDNVDVDTSFKIGTMYYLSLIHI